MATAVATIVVVLSLNMFHRKRVYKADIMEIAAAILSELETRHRNPNRVTFRMCVFYAFVLIIQHNLCLLFNAEC